MRETPKRMRPTSRPKHERRTKNTRQTPHSHYTNTDPRRKRREGDNAWLGSTPCDPTNTPPNRFYMPPQDAEPKHGKEIAQVCAVVLAGFAIMYAITWVYGHFRWGW